MTLDYSKLPSMIVPYKSLILLTHPLMTIFETSKTHVDPIESMAFVWQIRE